MTVANFQDLCKGFCELARIEPPSLVPDDRGIACFTVLMDGIAVSLAIASSVSAETGHMLVNFGQIPSERRLANWRNLLEANLRMHGECACVFGRDDKTGDVVLTRPFALGHTTSAGMYEFSVRAVQLARACQAAEPLFERDLPGYAEGHLAADAPDRGTVSADPAGFDALCSALRGASGVENPRRGAGAQGQPRFTFHVYGVQVDVERGDDRDPASLFVRVHFGSVPEEFEEAVLERLLEINAILMTQAFDPSFGRDASGEVVFRCGFQDADIDIEQVWATIENMVGTALMWRSGYFLDSEELAASAEPPTADWA